MLCAPVDFTQYSEEGLSLIAHRGPMLVQLLHIEVRVFNTGVLPKPILIAESRISMPETIIPSIKKKAATYRLS